MSKVIIYTRADGGLSVVHPIRNTLGEARIFMPADGEAKEAFREMTDAEIVQRALAKLPADAINPQIVEADAIPVDRTYRDAWMQQDGAVVHDMDKAREIQKDRLRALRAPLFDANDIAIQSALADGDSKALKTAVATRDALRDVTAAPAIEAAKTPDELKLAVPQILIAAEAVEK